MILSLRSIIRVHKLHKGKATRFPCVIILRDIDITDKPKPFKRNSKFFRSAVERDVSDQQASMVWLLASSIATICSSRRTITPSRGAISSSRRASSSTTIPPSWRTVITRAIPPHDVGSNSVLGFFDAIRPKMLVSKVRRVMN